MEVRIHCLIRFPIRPPVPKWLEDLLGVDFFSEVVRLDLEGPKVTDAVVEQLKRLPRLQWLGLRNTEITDATGALH